MKDHSYFFMVGWRGLCRIGTLLFLCMVSIMVTIMLFPWSAFALSARVTVTQTSSTVAINASADLQSCELNYSANQQIGWQSVNGSLWSCKVTGITNASFSIGQYPTIDTVGNKVYPAGLGKIIPVTYSDGACYQIYSKPPYSYGFVTVRKAFPYCTTTGIMDVYLDGNWVGGVSYGANKVSKQILLARSSLTIGAHTVKVVARSSLTQYAPAPVAATASFTTACGLSVTVTPTCTAVYPFLNNSRRSYFPNKYSTPVNVSVNLNNTPVSGASVATQVKMVAGTETYGGHDHGATDGANKPTGAFLTPSGATNAAGIFTTTYKASEFSGQDEITATASFNGCTGTSPPVVITSKIPGLIPITLPAGSPHQFVGGRCEHLGGYTPWNPGKTAACSGTTGTSNQYINSSISQTFYDFLNEYTLLHGAGLYINDASLKFGGMFDVNGGWCTACSHSTHRIGVDMDFALKDSSASVTGLPTDFPVVWKNIVRNNSDVKPIVSKNGSMIKIITPKISYQQHSVGTPNAHVHIFFRK
ncbi:MAG: hypothetical protein R8L58_01995 [Mariprofundaceae bacterium]